VDDAVPAASVPSKAEPANVEAVAATFKAESAAAGDPVEMNAVSPAICNASSSSHAIDINRRNS
jgi:hypothetical protein